MPQNNILSPLHVQKLGHELEEIRVRTLNNIISKLDHGTVSAADLISHREFIWRLLDWLESYHSSTEKEKILRLLIRIFKAANVAIDDTAVLGTTKMGIALRNIQSNIQPELSPLIDKILYAMSVLESKTEDLCRAQEPIAGTEATDSESESVNTQVTSVQDSFPDPIERPPSPLLSHRSQRFKQGYFSNSDDLRTAPHEYPSCFPHLLLPWQPLIATDRHVLTAVEGSLRNNRDPALILHTCHFFNDVMLQDFPAEVFLQRPSIVKSFLELLDVTRPGNVYRVNSMAMTCLHKLTAALHIRVHYYSDPCIANLKQETCTQLDSRDSSPSVPSTQRPLVEGCSGAGEYLRNYNPLLDAEQGTASQHPRKSSLEANNSGSDSDGDVEDSILLQLRQLNLPQFCLLALTEILPKLCSATSDPAELNTMMNLMLELTRLLTVCVLPDIWQCTDVISTETGQQIKHVLLLLGQTLEFHERLDNSEEVHRLVYLQLVTLTQKLIDSLVPNDLADEILPNVLKVMFVNAMFDYSLTIIFPSLHSDISKYAKTFSGQRITEVLHNFRDTEAICKSMRVAIDFIKNSERLEYENVFPLMLEALPSLVFHMNLEFVTRCVDICVKRYRGNSLAATTVIVKLLAHSETEVQQQMYALCHQQVLSVLGVDHSRPSRNAQQLTFLFDTAVLSEIVCHGTSNSNKQIQQHSNEILLHLIQGKSLMADSTWQMFLENLVPTLPLLQCFANKTTALGRAVAKMLDPDISSSIRLPQDEVLKGNLRLMFCVDGISRDEAVSRLLWLLSREPQSYDKLPELSSLQPPVLNALCIVERPAHIARNKQNQSFYEETSLCHVTELLSGESVEPNVKRSALTQVCVMLEDVRLHATFLEQGGIEIVFGIFHKAMLEKDFLNHPDSVIPIVTILKNIAHQNSKVRQQLAGQTSLFYCIIRAAFMFCNNARFRLDASQLMFLLLYSDLLLIAPESTKEDDETSYGASLPEIIAKRMRVPFLCHTHWRTSHHTDSSSQGILLNDKHSLQMLRLSWNMKWFGGVSKLIAWRELPPPVDDVSQCLCLDDETLRCLKATAITHCCRQQLYNVQNATSHQAVAAALQILVGYMNLHTLLYKTNVTDFQTLDTCWDELQWEYTLMKFLGTSPACDEDEQLLVIILQFLRSYMVARKGENCPWIVKIFKDKSHPLPNLLKLCGNGGGDGVNPSKDVCRELLLLAKECVISERRWESSSNDKNSDQIKKRRSWLHMITTIAQNLKFSDTQHFYNLSFLDWMLTCLSHLTGSVGWSSSGSAVVPLWRDLVLSLAELVAAFHCVRGGASFLGLSITCSAILCMNHLLVEMVEHTANKGWEQVWLSALAHHGNVNLSWLASLWQSRDPITRAAALQLSAGLCSSQQGCRLFMEGLNIWATGISFLLDSDESCLVREQAGILLTNLCSHGTSKSAESGSLALCHTPFSPGDVPAKGIQAVSTLLERSNFFGELATLISRLYIGATVDLGGYMITVDDAQWSVDSLSGRQFAPGTNLKNNEYILVYNKNLEESSQSVKSDDGSSESSDPYVVTTPSLVKSVCWLLVNLQSLIPETVLKNMQTFGLARSLFRCLMDTPKYSDETHMLQLYLDVVEMNTGICSTLAMCVAASEECREAVIHTNDSLHTLLGLLNPGLYPTHRPHLLFLRNRLWTSVFRLLSCALHDEQENSYRLMRDALTRSGCQAFLATVSTSMADNSSTDLVFSALTSLTSVLCHESSALGQLDASDVGASNSLQSLLDTPRSELSESSGSSSNSVIGGDDLCEGLLGLYEVQRLQQENQGEAQGRTAVTGALNCLLAVSKEAKRRALSRGLLETIIIQLRHLHVRLSLDTVESLRRISDKKKVCRVLKEVTSYFGLLMNFLSGCPKAKLSATEMGLADLVHKLWTWCVAWPPLLVTTLRLLCTFTADCTAACHSLVLTTTVPGVGLRKTASTMSLLHAVFSLVAAEMEAHSRRQSTLVLSLAFQLLNQACHAQKCRLVISKSNLFLPMVKLYPSLTKHQKHWENVEMIWLSFISDFTFYTEGQVCLPKLPDVLDLLITLATGGQTTTQAEALTVLRNISFNKSNRSRLLASGKFLKLLMCKLSEGSLDERYLAATIVWALVANNQKSKLIVKCAGIETKLQEAFNQLNVFIHDPDDKRVKTISDVLRMLRNEGKVVKSVPSLQSFIHDEQYKHS